MWIGGRSTTGNISRAWLCGGQNLVEMAANGFMIESEDSAASDGTTASTWRNVSWFRSRFDRGL
jgi:hypothetical protein